MRIMVYDDNVVKSTEQLSSLKAVLKLVWSFGVRFITYDKLNYACLVIEVVSHWDHISETVINYAKTHKNELISAWTTVYGPVM